MDFARSTKSESFWIERQKPCKKSLEERARNRLVTYGTSRMPTFTSLNPDTSLVTSFISDSVRRVGSPVKSQSKVAELDRWPY